MELIDKQAAIDVFGDIHPLDYNAQAYLERIKQLPSVTPKQRWIPVSERLPNSQTEVIISCCDDSGDTKFWYTASGWVTTDGKYWIVDNEFNPFVIAWMPLPEPYRERR